MSLIRYNPFERSLLRRLDDVFSEMAELEKSFPNWRNYANENALSLDFAFGEVQNTKEKFAVSLDVSQFKPEEVKVNLVGNELTVEGHHEEKNDKHGTIQRSFVRKYTLPENTDFDALRSTLSDKGKLTIEAPKKAQAIEQPKAIPITKA